jgi:hypothetical protein
MYMYAEYYLANHKVQKCRKCFTDVKKLLNGGILPTLFSGMSANAAVSESLHELIFRFD